MARTHRVTLEAARALLAELLEGHQGIQPWPTEVVERAGGRAKVLELVHHLDKLAAKIGRLVETTAAEDLAELERRRTEGGFTFEELAAELRAEHGAGWWPSKLSDWEKGKQPIARHRIDQWRKTLDRLGL